MTPHGDKGSSPSGRSAWPWPASGWWVWCWTAVWHCASAATPSVWQPLRRERARRSSTNGPLCWAPFGSRALVGDDLFPSSSGGRYELSSRVVTDYGLFCELVAQADEIEQAEVAEVRLAMGDWRAAEWAARRGLLAFPSDERMYRLLMRAASSAGIIPGVQRVFRELCDVIADPDLGVEPEDTLHPETVELLEELTGRRPKSDGKGA